MAEATEKLSSKQRYTAGVLEYKQMGYWVIPVAAIWIGNFRTVIWWEVRITSSPQRESPKATSWVGFAIRRRER